MFSKKKNTKKSKYRNLKISPIIPIIAIIEALVLIGVCTYSWFSLSSQKTVISDMLEVVPDSDLDIDFAYPDDQFIDINKYIHNFTFEPATSVDGRNIYFPTTGTFEKTNTQRDGNNNGMTFREGTVNDINSKYICIDFSLTNTGSTEIPVYLSSKSYFAVKDQQGNKTSSSAMRFAFYQNDDSIGNIKGTNTNNDSLATIYFYDNFPDTHSSVYFYAWNKKDNVTYKNANWPGIQMKHVDVAQLVGTSYAGCTNIYSYTFDTKMYDNFIINDGNDGYGSWTLAHQTKDIGKEHIHNGDMYYLKGSQFEGKYHDFDYPKVEGEANKYVYNWDHEAFTPASTGTYPIIAPGVSTGFKREYTPVVNIDNSTGEAIEVTSAFAGSFDDFLYKGDASSSNALFTIPAGQKQSLSLIIWLEGTDPSCDNSYENRDLDLDFIFVTADHNRETMYTYKFIDDTSSTWVIHTGASRTGNNIQPVVQMFDNTDDKGYLMSYDEPTRTWSCKAPDYISANDLEFRRVNPSDETDVWNRWQAGPCSVKEGNGFTFRYHCKDGDTVTYTALADSAPNSSYKNSGGQTPFASTNFAKSNGGFWGIDSQTLHSLDGHTHKIVLYDQYNRVANTNNNGSAFFSIKYEYNNQQVEYKFDGPYFDDNGKAGFYFANVPDTAISSQIEFTFKKYVGADTSKSFNNEQENNNLSFDTTFNTALSSQVGRIKGWFYQIGGSSTDPSSATYLNNCYWGSDILYIQNRSTIDSLDAGAWCQVEYLPSNGSIDGSTSAYSYLYEANAEFRGNQDSAINSAYISVVPCDKAYSRYTFERCNPNDHSSRYYYNPTTTPGSNFTIQITSSTQTYTVGGVTYTIFNNTIPNNHCLKNTYYYKRIFLNMKNPPGANANAKIGISHTKGSDNYITNSTQYTMTKLTDSTGEYDHYTATFSTEFEWIQFDRYSSSWDWWNKTFALNSMAITSCDGYTWNDFGSSSCDYTDNFGDLYRPEYDKKEKIGFELFDSSTNHDGKWVNAQGTEYLTSPLIDIGTGS